MIRLIVTYHLSCDPRFFYMNFQMPEKQKLINLLKVISDRKLLSGILALDVLWINFFTWRWNGVSFLRYFDFYILGEFTNFRICVAIIDVTAC